MNKQWTLVNFCEFDPYAVKSYCAVHNENENKNLGDITKVDETSLQPFNMICGGSPCQDFSVAGDQKGSVWKCQDCGASYNPLTIHWDKRDVCPICGSPNIDKTRSSLLVEFLRVVRANKPTFGIYENVKNIVGKKFLTTTFKLFEEELHEYGYNTYWKVLNAKNFGIPQNRERVYLIFIQKDKDNGKFTFPEGFDLSIRVKDILESNVDEKFYLDSPGVMKIKERFFRQALETFYGNHCEPGDTIDAFNKRVNRSGVSPTITTRPEGFKTAILPVIEEPFIVASRGRNPENPSDRTPGAPTEQRLEPNFTGCSNTITTVQKDNYICEPQVLRAVRTEYGRKIRKQYEAGEINEKIGNMRELSPRTDGISNTLTTVLKDNYLYEQKIDDMRIRKLTPKECWRLMGFADDQFDKAAQFVNNSQLYKQAGNSIVVDVLYHIYKELYKAMPYLFEDLKLSSFFSGIGAFEVALDRLYDNIQDEDVTDFSDAPEEIKEQIMANAEALEQTENRKKITLESFSNEELLAELQRRMMANKEEITC